VVDVAAGRAVITVRLGAERGAIRLEVLDNGPAISAADMPGLFDPFHATGKSTRGIGLGLAIAKTLVEEMGGKLHAESLAQGAMFRMTLPLGE
jgi:signal transduction histidine kinase